MNRRDLEQLKALHQEIATLEERYIITPKGEKVGDTYGDYSHGFKQIKIIQGISTKRSDAIRKRLEHKYEVLQLKVEEMESFLEAVEDSEMRDILRLYYANGLTQEEIGRRKGYSRQGITKKLDTFWKQNEK